MKTQIVETKNGQRVAPYSGQAPGFPITRQGRGGTYRLCQILPAVPQRLEWINAANLRYRDAA